jgi:hypothetical protein
VTAQPVRDAMGEFGFRFDGESQHEFHDTLSSFTEN